MLLSVRFFRLDFCSHITEYKVLPYNVASRGKRYNRACVKARNPDHERRILLTHALRTFNRTAAAFAYPAKPELQNAKHQRNTRHQRELSAIPQVGKAHLADIKARFRQNNEHREGPNEHRVLLVFCSAVSKFRIKVAKPERKSQRNADNRLDRIENFHRDFGEVCVGPSQVAKDNRDAKAGDQVSAEENLKRQGSATAKHLRHRRCRIRRRAKRDNRTTEQHFARQMEEFHNAPENRNHDKANDKSASLDFERVAMRLRRNLRHERKEHHDADSERQERRQEVRLRKEDARQNRNGHENRA